MENKTSVKAHELVVVAHLVAALAFLASTHRLLPASIASWTFPSLEASASVHLNLNQNIDLSKISTHGNNIHSAPP